MAITGSEKAMFIYCADKTKLPANWETTYADKIIFIGSTKEIWAKGVFYASSDDFNTLKDKVNGIKYFDKVSADGSNVKTVSGAEATLNFISGAGINVTTTDTGINIAFDGTIIATGSTNGTISVNGTDVAVKGLGTAAYKADTYFATPANVSTAKSEAIAAAKTESDKKIASITGSNAINVSTNASKAATVELKLDNTGNVKFSQTTTGLKADVTIPAATVTGVKSTDKVLALDGTELTATLDLNYNSTSKKIQLIGKDASTVIGEIDATDFIKDGMISDVSINSDDKLVITWNTDSGKEATSLDLSKYIDAYDGKNLNLSQDYTKATTYAEPVKGESVDTVIGKLTKGIADVSTAAANAASADKGVMSIGGQKGALTLKNNTDDKSVGLTITGTEISAKLNLDTTTWDSALQNVELSNTSNGSDNTVKLGLTTKASNKQTLSLTVKTQDIETASDTSNGLAMAKDVKNYVDNRMSWIVIE